MTIYKVVPRMVLVLFCAAGLSQASGGGYKFSQAGNVPGSSETVPIAVSLTHIVGYYEASGILGGYIQSGNHQFVTPMPATARVSYLSGINEHGVAVGGFCTFGCLPLAAEHGFTYNVGTGAIKAFDFPGVSDGTVAYGINDLGDIVGGYCPGPCPQSLGAPATHGFRFSNHKFITLDYPAQHLHGTSCLAINDTGTIVGFYETDAVTSGFLYQNGGYSQVNFPGGLFTMPMAVNNSGVVSGYFADTNDVLHGFIYQAGTYTQVDVPPQRAIETSVSGVNDAGVLVGIYLDNQQFLHNFKAVPKHVAP